MGNLAHNKVYQVQLGRVFAADDAPRAPDVVSKGLDSLTWGVSSPLTAFNTKFEALRRRRRITPLVPARSIVTAVSASENGHGEQTSTAVTADVTQSTPGRCWLVIFRVVLTCI